MFFFSRFFIPQVRLLRFQQILNLLLGDTETIRSFFIHKPKEIKPVVLNVIYLLLSHYSTYTLDENQGHTIQRKTELQK